MIHSVQGNVKWLHEKKKHVTTILEIIYWEKKSISANPFDKYGRSLSIFCRINTSWKVPCRLRVTYKFLSAVNKWKCIDAGGNGYCGISLFHVEKVYWLIGCLRLGTLWSQDEPWLCLAEICALTREAEDMPLSEIFVRGCENSESPWLQGMSGGMSLCRWWRRKWRTLEREVKFHSFCYNASHCHLWLASPWLRLKSFKSMTLPLVMKRKMSLITRAIPGLWFQYQQVHYIDLIIRSSIHNFFFLQNVTYQKTVLYGQTGDPEVAWTPCFLPNHWWLWLTECGGAFKGWLLLNKLQQTVTRLFL